MWIFLACAGADLDSGDRGPGIRIPGHNECLPEGEEMTAEVCLAVVEDQGRSPTASENKSGDEPGESAPRLDDPELQWLTSEVNRCACRCCHTASWGGAGVYFWDLEYSPVWTDSASLWSLGVFAGWTEEDDQTLPTADIERVRAYVQSEWDRRGGEGGY
jgi:hypothetical protein